ncbi:Glycerophosphoryl diester phosphodiesterase [Anatilimnocola aggregata]|uniref:Glycerophosphoryl diester phosphodiesterase n=1 Tax=Anatilimnocola aggregata TaxID=2528021 RepID=A0A517YNH9_9BACT|nr:glycerophosphodiester phosphodiesterase family protein [Anatilimnocola aggregata]QDU31760.1 Glycerophosphoryl diester phosphodiesterase [Anatilimnocola aggregata]
MAVVDNHSLSAPTVLRAAWSDFTRAWRGLVIYELLFKLVDAWLLVPAVALLLRTVLAHAGRFTVTNHEILDFLFTPLGILYAAIFGTVAVTSRLIEQAGIMLVVSLATRGERPTLMAWLKKLFFKSLNITKLGAVKVVLLTVVFAPFVALAVITYGLLLTQHDIYFYWINRPPVFWLAAGIGLVILLGAASVGCWLYVRWAFALPIALFEQKLAHVALRTSAQRVRGIGWRVAAFLLGWQFLALLMAALVGIAYRQLALLLIGAATERPGWLVLLLLLVQALLLAAVSFVAAVGQGALMRRLYLSRAEQLGVDVGRLTTEEAATSEPRSILVTRLVYVSLSAVLLSPILIWIGLLQAGDAKPWVKVTAHRGHARAAPENTLAAIRKAIESGADYAEIDVQLTADGHVILLHDRDLKRVARDSRRLADLNLAELRQLDVGSWFASSFAGERVPTLEEVIALAKGRIKLNIELKYYGPDDGLARRVAEVVADQGFTKDALVTSFNYEALLENKRHNPAQRVGLIVAHSLGDVSRLEVDALSVRADHLNDAMLRSARRLKREVHVWTVNDRTAMTQWIQRDVDNLITSDPDLAIEVRREWSELGSAEQLLQSSRVLLGI